MTLVQFKILVNLSVFQDISLERQTAKLFNTLPKSNLRTCPNYLNNAHHGRQNLFMLHFKVRQSCLCSMTSLNGPIKLLYLWFQYTF